MPNRQLKWQAAAIAVSGIVTVGALAAAVTGQEQRATAVGVLSLGQTTTSTTPGGPITVAKPVLKAKKPKGF